MMRLSKILLVSVLLVTAGCSGMEDHSSCTKIDGISGCATMNTVNQMVNSGEISADNNGNVYRGYNKKGWNKTSRTVVAPDFFLPNAVNPSPKSSVPMRVGGRVIDMVVFPFLDKEDNYHDTQIINLLYTKPHWSKPAIAKIQDAEVGE